MAEHDLSALDGLLDELDIEERGNEDPRAAKLKALFEKAKAEYTAKIDVPTWYIQATSTTAPFIASTFKVPSPKELLARRKADRTGSTKEEWTISYLYKHGHFELCLSYVASFAVSMGIGFPFGANTDADSKLIREHDSSQLELQRTKQERELSKNWGIVKDVIDAGVRSLLTLLRNTTTNASIDAWISAHEGHSWGKVTLEVLASGFLAFCMREVRVGACDSRSGYSGMVITPSEGGKQLAVDMDKVRLQNWTVTHGLALTAGDLALELGLYRTAIEAHTLFLACRGQMWRVLLALAHELSCYYESLCAQTKVAADAIYSLKFVAKAALVSALQAVPRSRKLEIAHTVLTQHRIIPAAWINEVLDPDYVQHDPFRDEDDLLFNGLLQHPDPLGWSLLPEEVGIALVKVVFAKKSGILTIASKFPSYMREYEQRLQATANADGEWAGELDAADEEDANENGPRSVRTL